MKKSVFLFFLILISIGLHGQIKTVSNETYVTCFYSVSQIPSQEKWDQLVAYLGKTEGVEKIKSVYKPEQGRGQLILLIKASSGNRENIKEFDLAQIKSIIIQMGLQPEEPEIKDGKHI
ncbi:MAG: hypothetical protein N2167_02925 [Flavobacteriales bacterium]|nr:hypothetical protein [Flavobacteriales bacterium]